MNQLQTLSHEFFSQSQKTDFDKKEISQMSFFQTTKEILYFLKICYLDIRYSTNDLKKGGEILICRYSPFLLMQTDL